MLRKPVLASVTLALIVHVISYTPKNGGFTLITTASATTCETFHYPVPSEQPAGSYWCWAASLEYVYFQYNAVYRQQFLAERFCERYHIFEPQVPESDCQLCDLGNGEACYKHCYQDWIIAGYLQVERFVPTSTLGYVAVEDAQSFGLDGLHSVLCSHPQPFLFAVLGYDTPSTVEGHMVVVYGLDYTNPLYDEVYLMDPARGQEMTTTAIPFFDWGQTEFDWWGKWINFIGVTGYNGPLVGIEHIESFEVARNGSNVDLTFVIHGGAPPDEYAAVYISDNGIGPARLIEELVDFPLLGDPNYWSDTYRLPYSGANYYYYLDHDEWYDETNEIENLYPAVGNPINFPNEPARPIFLPATNINAQDAPFDRGHTLNVTWSLSADDNRIDCYNLYRKSYPPGENPALYEWNWVRGFSPGTASYADGEVSSQLLTKYMISAAHHGDLTIQPGDGNYAIWNDFGQETGPFQSRDDFADLDIALLSHDTLFTCPAGDEDSLEVLLTVKGL